MRRELPAQLRGRRLRLAWYDDGLRRPRPDPRPLPRAGQRWRLDAAPARAARPAQSRRLRWRAHALAQRIAATGYVREPMPAHRAGAAAQASTPGASAMSLRIAAVGAGRDPRASCSALALGDTRGLDDADWERLRATGLTHLIAISGFHVGLVAGFCALLAARAVAAVCPALGRRVAAAAWPPALAALRRRAAAMPRWPASRCRRCARVLMIAVVAARAAAAPAAAAWPRRWRWPLIARAAGRSAGGAGRRFLAQLRRRRLAAVVPAATAIAGAVRELAVRAGRGHAGPAAADGGAVRPGLAGRAAGQPGRHSVVEPGGGAAVVARHRRWKRCMPAPAPGHGGRRPGASI